MIVNGCTNSTGGVYPSETAVAVQPDDDRVDHVEVEDHGGQPDHPDPGRAAPAPAGRGPRVQVGRIDHPDHERPGLLGVPAPVATPGRLAPDSSRDDGEGPDREGDGGRLVG